MNASGNTASFAPCPAASAIRRLAFSTLPPSSKGTAPACTTATRNGFIEALFLSVAPRQDWLRDARHLLFLVDSLRLIHAAGYRLSTNKPDKAPKTAWSNDQTLRDFALLSGWPSRLRLVASYGAWFPSMI